MRFIGWVNVVTKESWASWERLCEVKTSRVDELFEDLKVALDEYAVALDGYAGAGWDEDSDGYMKVEAATSAYAKAYAAWRSWRKAGGDQGELIRRTFNSMMALRGYPGHSQARKDIEEPPDSAF